MVSHDIEKSSIKTSQCLTHFPNVILGTTFLQAETKIEVFELKCGQVSKICETVEKSFEDPKQGVTLTSGLKKVVVMQKT